jgi:DUF4097 and DUF4098 domain-containing protein YvlB
VVFGSGRTTATAAVKGPVGFRLETISADVEVVAGSARQVTLTLLDSDQQSIRLVARGDDRMQAEFDGRSQLRNGRIRLELPRGSHLDVATVSGDFSAQNVGGEVRFRSMSGDARIVGATVLEVHSVSSEVLAEGVGAARIKTVAGDARVTSTAGLGAQLEFESTSGDLAFAGACGAHCRITASSVSGDVELRLDPQSSFDLRYTSHSGDLTDGLGMAVEQRSRRFGTDLQSRYGKGEGVIEYRSFSGDLTVKKR